MSHKSSEIDWSNKYTPAFYKDAPTCELLKTSCMPVSGGIQVSSLLKTPVYKCLFMCIFCTSPIGQFASTAQTFFMSAINKSRPAVSNAMTIVKDEAITHISMLTIFHKTLSASHLMSHVLIGVMNRCLRVNFSGLPVSQFADLLAIQSSPHQVPPMPGEHLAPVSDPFSATSHTCSMARSMESLDASSNTPILMLGKLMHYYHSISLMATIIFRRNNTAHEAACPSAEAVHTSTGFNLQPQVAQGWSE